MGFPRQEYWNELPFPFPGGLPDPGIESLSPTLRQILYCRATREALLYGNRLTDTENRLVVANGENGEG